MNVFDLYENKRVLVTGHTGFKGSWISYWLHSLGADVCGIALAPEKEEDHFVELGLENKIEHHICDIRDAEAVRAIVHDFKPEIVFHLAAQPLVLRSYDEPMLTFETNVMGSINVWDAVRSCPSVRAMINVTSDKCYKNKDWIWGYRENDELGGQDPYSASKACAEIAFEAYRRSFFDKNEEMFVASVRAGNVIGGGDWADNRIVPDCIRAFQQGEAVVIRSPHATRPWQHVLEPLGGYMHLAAHLYQYGTRFEGAWNFGPASEANRPVLDVVQSLIEKWDGAAFELLDSNAERLHEAKLLHVNSDKASHNLGWKVVWEFQDTMAKTAEWYYQRHQGVSAEELTKKQIQEFTAIARSRYGGHHD